MREPIGAQALADRDATADLFAEIALAAGPLILALYEGGCDIRAKADASPVSEADEQAEALILARLAESLPGLAVVAEESCSRSGPPSCPPVFILVDPLDGTREFVNRNGEFTVNIALVADGAPVAGAVYAPVLGEIWWGATKAFHARLSPQGERTEVRRIATRSAPPDGLIALASRSHGDPQTEAFLARLPVFDRHSAGSSLKFCRIAEGLADVYPRFSRTMEWDVAAGHAVLAAAGGAVLAGDGAPFLYGKSSDGFANPSFVAWGDPRAAERFR